MPVSMNCSVLPLIIVEWISHDEECMGILVSSASLVMHNCYLQFCLFPSWLVYSKYLSRYFKELDSAFVNTYVTVWISLDNRL
ncbi:hypothetical protein SLEP1_g54317 [Rubroshorea leprosula]|uniref:Uncharacterized protein n=1 Tax=Rubroshorea leprosula TaxID=152421 RepID=A0AAV5MD24_9ROSI|nr:hypothetical protein SLEP1_g54317 [Rubroshorea leprosula]